MKRAYKIVHDEDAPNPRKEFDCFGKMVCFHRRYDLGDKHDLKVEDFNGWDELEAYLKEDLKAAVVLPLYLYDHSGITINTTGFSCPWDSGQVGFVYATEEMVKKEFGSNDADALKRAETLLLGEVQTYDQYLTGDVWGFVIEDENGEKIDSCWGFYGENYCREEAERCLAAVLTH